MNSNMKSYKLYDIFSLGDTLKSIGFTNIKKTDAFSSSISKWNSHNLDIDQSKEPRKKDSLYVEAVKP